MSVDARGRVPLLRLATAGAAMAAAGSSLPLLAPDPVGAARSLAAVQHLADTAGPDAVVLRVAGLLVWLVWGWGALGLVLTAAGALPGVAGALARALLRLAVPAAARRAATLALGVGIGLNGTVLAAPALAGPPTGATAGTTLGAPDWPGAPPAATTAAPVADRPATPPGTHVVVRGDCLWRIAGTALPGTPSNARVARAVQAWWAANRAVIGADPDLLLPGQVLNAPAPVTGGDR